MPTKLTSFLTFAAVAGFAGAASAADIYQPPPPISSPIYVPAPAFTWTGAYIGLHGGYAWGSANAEFASGDDGARDFKPNGWFGGGQIGANWQTPSNLVLGIEGDIAAAGLSDTFSGPGAFGGTVEASQKVSALASIRGRLGYAAGNWLPYVTGGVAFAHAKREYDGPGGPASPENWHTGWTIGAGLEYAMSQNWTIRGEYRYSDFGSKNYAVPSPGGLGTDVDLQLHTVSLGLNYKF